MSDYMMTFVSKFVYIEPGSFKLFGNVLGIRFLTHSVDLINLLSCHTKSVIIFILMIFDKKPYPEAMYLIIIAYVKYKSSVIQLLLTSVLIFRWSCSCGASDSAYRNTFLVTWPVVCLLSHS